MPPHESLRVVVRDANLEEVPERGVADPAYRPEGGANPREPPAGADPVTVSPNEVPGAGRDGTRCIGQPSARGLSPGQQECGDHDPDRRERLNSRAGVLDCLIEPLEEAIKKLVH